MLYFTLDLEYNQFFDFYRTGRHPEPACPSEIIQMGVVVMDDRLNIKLKRETLVRPQIYQRLHPHVARVTGISSDDLRGAPAFPAAFEDFFGFALGKRAVFCTWGGDDIKELYRNILYYSLNHKRISRQFLNVQKLFGASEAGLNLARSPAFTESGEPILPHIRQVGLKSAVTAVGLPAERPFHCALSDAEYTAEILRYVLRDKSVNIKNHRQTLSLEDLRDSINFRVHGVNIRLLQKHAEHMLGRKLNDRDKEAFFDMYKMGRENKFDVNKL